MTGRRRLACTLPLAVLVTMGAAHAQGPCSAPDVKAYLGGLRWPRAGPTSQPPRAWEECQAASSQHQALVMRAFAELRTKAAGAQPGASERTLLSGGDGRITPDLLNGWRSNLGAPSAPGSFDNPHYQSLLGSLALMVLDRSRGLERLEVAPVRRLQEALRQKPAWPAIEAGLAAFRHVRLWGPAPSGELALGDLGVMAREISETQLGAPEAQQPLGSIRKERENDVYWRRIAPPIDKIRKLPVETRVAWSAAPPSGCASALCQALQQCGRKNTPAAWGSLQERFRKDLAAERQALPRVRESLGGAHDLGPLAALLERAAEVGERLLAAPAYALEARTVEQGVKDLSAAAARLRRLEEGPAAYRQALLALVEGDPGEARRIVGGSAAWKRAPRLAAAYVAAAYLASGQEGARAACAEGAPCAQPETAAGLRRIDRILGLPQSPLAGIEDAGTP